MLCTARTMPSQDACQSVGLSVCLSVIRLSVTRRYCTETAKHYHQRFSPSANNTILALPHQNVKGILRLEPPLTEASNVDGMKKSQLSTNILLYLGNDT